MIWVDREAKKIAELNHKSEWVDDMKTPSGRVHVGALRGVVIHDLLYKALRELGVKTTSSYVFNDFDQMDAIPSYLDFDEWEQYAGMPLCNIPSPVAGFESFAQYFAQEFIEVFNSINCHPKIIWGSKLYRAGKLNNEIKDILDKSEKVREIYMRIAKSKRPKNWYPLQVVCEKCGKAGTTMVTAWDGEKVTYKCNPTFVAWAKGCGHQGKVSPYDGRSKLLWKLDWPANWKVIGITVEGSGKDHMSAGGSYDLSKAISEEVLDYPAPYAPAYEWFTVGGRKMSSSKGIGSSAKEVSSILPPQLLRFLIVRTPIDRHLDFNPEGDTILNLFDDYDRCLSAYFDKLESKIPEGKPGEVIMDFARIMELSAVAKLPSKRHLIPRFRTIVNVLKSNTDPEVFFAKQKKKALTAVEKNVLKERVKYAKLYIQRTAESEKSDEDATPTQPTSFTADQKTFLKELAAQLKKSPDADRDGIQTIVFGILKKHGFQPRDIFKAFYRVLAGKDFGPKAADIIMERGIKTTISEIESALKS
jgi:lysyl-tRNA synthetase, class I